MPLIILQDTHPGTDTLSQYLGTLGYTGSLNDRQFQYLRAQGYLGTLDDMKRALELLGGGPWSTIPDAALWAEPSYSDSVTLVDSKVSTIAGRDSTGNALVQSNEALRPHLSGTIGSAAALEWQQASFVQRYMSVQTPITYTDSAFTIIAAFQAGDLSSVGFLFAGDVGSIGLRLNTNGSLQALRTGQLSLATTASSLITANSDHVVVVRGDSSGVDLIVDGTTEINGATAPAITQPTDLIGGYDTGAAIADRWGGFVGTIAVFTRTLTDEEVNTAASNVASTHGLTWGGSSSGFSSGFSNGFG